MGTTTALMTAEELLRLPRGQFRYELINGELKKMSPTGHEHGRIAMRLSIPLGSHVYENGLGEVYAAETGFKLTSNPDTVRAPDLSFIRRARVIEIGKTRGYWPGAPDLAVEVMSPDDRLVEVEEKAREWLVGGAEIVWVVNPAMRSITVYRSNSAPEVLTETDELEGESVLPGFKYQVAKLFD